MPIVTTTVDPDTAYRTAKAIGGQIKKFCVDAQTALAGTPNAYDASNISGACADWISQLSGLVATTGFDTSAETLDGGTYSAANLASTNYNAVIAALTNLRDTINTSVPVDTSGYAQLFTWSNYRLSPRNLPAAFTSSLQTLVTAIQTSIG